MLGHILIGLARCIAIPLWIYFVVMFTPKDQGKRHMLETLRNKLFTCAQELAEGADTLITMGCGDKCPVVPGLKRDD